MNNVDMGTVIANTLFGFTFSGILVLLALLAVGALWCTVPFAVFGVKKRLDGIEVAQRSQTDMLIGELKRINDNLRQRVSVNAGSDGGEAPVMVTQPSVVRNRIERATTFREEIDLEMQAEMDAVEEQLAARVAAAPMQQQSARQPVRPATILRPATASAANAMFGQRPPTLGGALAQNAALAQSRAARPAMQFGRA